MAELVPPPSAVPTAADEQQYDDNDQKSCGVHIVLLKSSELKLTRSALLPPRLGQDHNTNPTCTLEGVGYRVWHVVPETAQVRNKIGQPGPMSTF
jgi:hypothetical protein